METYSKHSAESKELLDACYLMQRQMSGGQQVFYQGCRMQYNKTGELSEKQMDTLKGILKFLPRETRFSNTVKHEEKKK